MYRTPTSFVDMSAVHASTGSARTGGTASLRSVHPELVEGWSVSLLSSSQVGYLYTNDFRQAGLTSQLTATLAFLLFLLIAVTSASAQDKDLIAAGQQEFRHSCVVCHGLTGKGESVMTTLNLLAIKPPDLRQLRKRNKGTFPFWQMYRVIDGRQEILAHGSRDMPMWGDIFIRQENGTIADDARAIGRILQVLYYLESIQEK